MMGELQRTLDRFRKPEYVGSNRCLPCTILNLAIALLVAGLVSIFSLPAGLVVFAASAGIVYFRGYLLPGTPTLTRRYFPATVLSLFGKDDEQETTVTRPADVENVATHLTDNDVVVECPDEDDLCLDTKFHAAWWDRIGSCREEATAKEKLATTVGVDPESIGIRRSERYSITHEGDRVGTWSSEAAFLADLAAEPTLAEWIPEWEALTDDERTELLVRLRVFLEFCPSCDGEVTATENVAQSCCAESITQVSTECERCGDVVFTGSVR